jgi:DNA-directed RNA polymerase specialized sigma24 family protein
VLSRDWYRADDLVSDCVVKVLRSWSRIDAMEDRNAYLHRVLINTWLDERRGFRRCASGRRTPCPTWSALTINAPSTIA